MRSRRRRRRFPSTHMLLRWASKVGKRRYGDPNAPRVAEVAETSEASESQAGPSVSVVEIDGTDCRHRFEGGNCLCPRGECWLSEQEAALRRGLDPEPYSVWLAAKVALHTEAETREWSNRAQYRKHLRRDGTSKRRDRRQPIHPRSARQYAYACAYNLLRNKDPGWFYRVDFTPQDLARIRDEWFALLFELRKKAGDEADVLRNKREGHGRTVWRQDILGVLREIPVVGGIVPGKNEPGVLPKKQYGFRKLDPTPAEIREEARQRGREDVEEYQRAKARIRERAKRLGDEPPLMS